MGENSDHTGPFRHPLNSRRGGWACQYLCIVADRGGAARATGDLFLPFEGDATLALILSKALLLADDTRISDPTITRQLKPR